MGILCLTACTKNIVPENPKNSPALTGVIAEDVKSKTALEGVDVSWVKDDRIAVQLSDNHRENAFKPKGGYATGFGVYKLVDEAAGGKVGKFIFDSGDEEILGDEEFFAFYPASFCTCNPSNGYFYFDFPMTQHYEDNVGGKLQLPMYGIGSSRNIDFKYAGAVIVLRIWSETETKVHSCVINAKGGLAKKAFTYYVQEKGKWSPLQHAHSVSSLNLDMRNPLAVSTDETNPTEIVFIVPLAGERTMENLKFSINCTEGGCELIKKSPLTIKPGSKVSFPVTKIKLDPNRMYVDELEGEIDFDWIKTAQESVTEKNENPEKGMATTMGVLDIEGKTAQWAHVGDSRLYFFRKNRFEAHTKDHSVPQMLVNIGQIKESEIRHHPDRSSLLHTIGYPWDGNPCEASEQIRIRSGDAFLLCSDGFWENIEDAEMEEILAQSPDVETWLENMTEAVKTHAGDADMDNCSAICVYVE